MKKISAVCDQFTLIAVSLAALPL